MDVKAETTGSRIKSCRIKLGLTQGDLGSLVGVSATAIMRYERGEREPKIQTFRLIAKALNVSENYLLLLTDDPTPTIGFVDIAFELGLREIAEIDTGKIAERAEQLRKESVNHHRKLLPQAELDQQISSAIEQHTEYLSQLCCDPAVLAEDYPKRIMYVTNFVKNNADMLKVAMPGTQILEDDAKEAQIIRATGGTPDNSK